MSKKTTITCICLIEVEANEYEALTAVDEMLQKKHAVVDTNTGLLLEKITLTVNETITTRTEKCGIIYNK
jgi:hypothetical protein